MTFDEYEDYHRIKQIHDVVRAAGEELETVKGATGRSAREAFIAAFDMLSSRQVSQIMSEALDPDHAAKIMRRTLSTEAKVNKQLAATVMANSGPDELAVEIAKSQVADPKVQSSLAQAVRLLLIAQVSITLVLRAISIWLGGENVTFVDALKKVGVSDDDLLRKVVQTGIE